MLNECAIISEMISFTRDSVHVILKAIATAAIFSVIIRSIEKFQKISVKCMIKQESETWKLFAYQTNHASLCFTNLYLYNSFILAKNMNKG